MTELNKGLLTLQTTEDRLLQLLGPQKFRSHTSERLRLLRTESAEAEAHGDSFIPFNLVAVLIVNCSQHVSVHFFESPMSLPLSRDSS